MVVSCDDNLPSWFIPMKLCTSIMVVGVFICRIAETFSGSRDILVLSIAWHRKIFSLPKHTFLWNEVTLAYETCCKISFNLSLCSSLVPSNTKTSSTQHITPLSMYPQNVTNTFLTMFGSTCNSQGKVIKTKVLE